MIRIVVFFCEPIGNSGTFSKFKQVISHVSKFSDFFLLRYESFALKGILQFVSIYRRMIVIVHVATLSIRQMWIFALMQLAPIYSQFVFQLVFDRSFSVVAEAQKLRSMHFKQSQVDKAVDWNHLRIFLLFSNLNYIQTV